MIRIVAAVRDELGDLDGVPLGVGPVVAAVHMARLIAEDPPDGVVFLGTCGAYPGGPALGSVVQAARVGFADGVSAMGLGYTPRPPGVLRCDARLRARIGLPEVDVLTVPSVSTDPTLTGRLGDAWQVEHLEAYGAACACEAAGVPFAVVLGVANWVGPDAHAQWLTRRHAAQDAARDAIRAALLG